MRTIDRASAFKRDYKREAKGQHRATLDSDLKPVLVALATDQPLDAKFRDHDLSGDWAGYRECHVKPDLMLPLFCGVLSSRLTRLFCAVPRTSVSRIA